MRPLNNFCLAFGMWVDPDLADFDSVQAFVKEFVGKHKKLHILVNNGKLVSILMNTDCVLLFRNLASVPNVIKTIFDISPARTLVSQEVSTLPANIRGRRPRSKDTKYASGPTTS